MADADIKIKVTTDHTGATRGLAEVGGQADGLGGKIRNLASHIPGLNKLIGDTGTAAGGSGGMLSALGGTGAVAAAGVTAAAAAAAKGLMDFERLGVEIGKLTAATGLTAEEASRLKEASSDLGIEQGTLETNIGKMSKTLGANAKAFESLGIQVARNADGTVNMSETFLRSVDAINSIQDPLKRSEAASDVFGKGWKSMAELISRGAPQLRADLAAVSDAKVFDDNKIAQARDLREAFDAIADAGQDLFLTIGQSLAPAISELAPIIAENVKSAKPFIEGFGKLASAILGVIGPIAEITNKIAGPFLNAIGKGAEKAGQLIDALSSLGEHTVDLGPAYQAAMQKMKEAETVTDDLTYSTSEAARVAEVYEDAARNAAIALDEAEQSTRELETAYKDLTGELSDDEAWIGVQNEIDAYKAKIGDATASNREKRQAIIDLKQKLTEYLTELEGVPTEKRTQVLALIDQGRFNEAEAALAWLGRNRPVVYNPQTGGQAPAPPRFDNGGVVPGPIGSEQLVIAHGGERISPTHKFPDRKPATGTDPATPVVVDQSTNIYHLPPGVSAERYRDAGRRLYRRGGGRD